MAEKKFLSWVGFKGEESVSASEPTSADALSNASQSGSQSNVARIRELENQLAELRSRRDITSLTKEEFEILASETAMVLIKTAQQRESKALATSQKLFSDSSRISREMIDSAEAKAKSLLAQAESRGRKYIEAAETDAEALIAEAAREAEQLVTAKKREATAVTTAAKREAESMVAEAVADIAEYRGWLSTAISEADRLHRIQTQALNAAEQAIEQTRNRLASAFEKLSSLQGDIDANLDSNNRPKGKNYVRANGATVETEAPVKKNMEEKPEAKKAATKKVSARKASSKKPAAKKVAKKAVSKKSSAKRK